MSKKLKEKGQKVEYMEKLLNKSGKQMWKSFDVSLTYMISAEISNLIQDWTMTRSRESCEYSSLTGQ